MRKSPEWLFDLFETYGDETAIVEKNGKFTYAQLLNKIDSYRRWLDEMEVASGESVAIHSDYSFDAIALFFALAAHRCIVVPIISEIEGEIRKRLEIAQVNRIFEKSDKKFEVVLREGNDEQMPFLEELRAQGDAGLVLFSSGSTGEPKGMLHNLDNLIESYRGRSRKNLNTLVFLTFDHIGGFDTMMRTLSMGGALTIPESRRPEKVCEAIQNFEVDVLPASPTFINLMLLGGMHERYNLSSLKILAFGAEPMPVPLLARLRELFPDVELQQKFGTSETSAIRIKNGSDGSLFFRIDDSKVRYKVVDGELWLKSETQMLGYLNADTATVIEEGWFRTGDLVEEREDGCLKIVGRNKEVINVGGEKVLPSEVEEVLHKMPEVADVMVYGEPDAIMGQKVVADIVPDGDYDRKEMKKLVRKFCKGVLESYKIPGKINLVDRTNFGGRFKKIRRK